METNRLEKYPIWLEHTKDRARGSAEDPHTFYLVTLASYEPMDFVSVTGPEKWIGKPNWEALDRATIEALIGSPL